MDTRGYFFFFRKPMFHDIFERKLDSFGRPCGSFFFCDNLLISRKSAANALFHPYLECFFCRRTIFLEISGEGMWADFGPSDQTRFVALNPKSLDIRLGKKKYVSYLFLLSGRSLPWVVVRVKSFFFESYCKKTVGRTVLLWKKIENWKIKRVSTWYIFVGRWSESYFCKALNHNNLNHVALAWRSHRHTTSRRWKIFAAGPLSPPERWAQTTDF